MAEKIKILFLSAEPVNTQRLRLGQEIRDIEEKLRVAPKARSFQLISQWAVRPRDLMETMMIYRPTVVHFSGHASGGKLILENDTGETQPIEGSHLAALLAEFSDTIRLVVLNACFTSPGFDVLAKVIDHTVGTTSALTDSAAIRFSSCFYQALAFGNSVQAAYELAKHQITLEELTGPGVFTLLTRGGVDTSEPFVRSRPRPAGSKNATRSARKAESKDSEGSHKSPLRETAIVRESDGEGNQVYNSTAGSVELHAEGVRGVSDQIPAEIKESLKRFRRDYPDAHKMAFLMMRFGRTKAHESIVAGIRAALDPLKFTVVRADDKQYHDDLLPNILTYIYGCNFGIAVFERIETEQFNPNVALEVGYMLALKKSVCLLKDRTLNTLHADLVGKLYRVFDPLDPIATIPPELSRWLSDKDLGGAQPGAQADG